METKTMHIPLLKASAVNGLIVGYASVFNLKDEQGDIVMRGAFGAALATQKGLPPMLWMHDSNRPCGAWLKMNEDVIGLLVRGRLALATQLGQEAYALVKQGAVTGLSIGYRIKRSSFDAVKKARLLHEIILDEVSLVTMPANPAARISGVKYNKMLDAHQSNSTGARALAAIIAAYGDKRYDPGQPRAPRGTSDGGQWIDTGASRTGTSTRNSARHTPVPRRMEELRRLDPPLQSVYPIETLAGLGALGRTMLPYAARQVAAVISGAIEARRATVRIQRAAKAIEKYLGGPAKVSRNPAGDMYIERGDKKIRFDINNTYPHKEPHFHLQRKTASGNWRPATPKKRYSFKETKQ